MRRSARLAFLFALTLALPAPGADRSPRSSDAGLRKKLDAYLSALAEARGFSGSVLVARGKQVILAQGYGLADAEHKVPNTPATRFRIGSVTKQFTAMAIMQLAQEGKLGLNDPICKWLEKCPTAWAPITIHHLLTHTSGIPNFTNFDDYRATRALPSPPARTIERFSTKPLDFPPGTSFRYSNSGYVLLGVVLEKAAGKPYEEVLRERIFQPLGMSSTGYDHSEVVLENRARGYTREKTSVVNAAFIHMSIPFAAGALYSTVEDLHRWSEALSTEKLLPVPALERLFTPEKEDYAYGWIVSRQKERKKIWHNGGIDGFGSNITRFPEIGLTVIVLSNQETALVDTAARDLSALALGDEVELPRVRQVVAIDPKVLPEFVGNYELRPGFILVVTSEGEHLYAQATGQERFEIFAEGKDRFFPQGFEAQLEFVRDPGGQVTSLVLHQNGRTMLAPKQR